MKDMKKLFKKRLPSTKSMKNSKELKGLKPFLKGSYLWSRDLQSVARGVAAGLAGCVIPGFQFFYAALLAILLKGNLPIALVFTFVTNPFTVAPITYFIYLVGSLLVGNNESEFVIQHFQWDFSSYNAFWTNVSAWMLQFGKAFLVGLPIVSFCLGVIGYVGTILIWEMYVGLSHRRRNKK
jgi:uncharacterized protein (DUF2062 family)